ncbi:MAG: DUF3822 family protein [Chitinophagaceae bacterium]
MIHPAFHIKQKQTGEDDYLQSLLLMEANPHGLSYLVLHQVRQEVLDAKYYTLPGAEGKNLSDRFRTIIDTDEVLHQQFRESMVLYNFAEGMLVPDTLFNLETNRELIDLAYGSVSKGLILSEKVPSHPAHTTYRIPADVHSLFQHSFNTGKYWHIYTLWLASLKNFPPEAEDNQAQLYVLFYPDRMLVAVYKNTQLQLVQTFEYQVAEDVVYYLLNICRQLQLSAEEALVVVSGYAQHDSPLFTEMRKYFMHCRLDEAPATFTTQVFDPLPAHFFSPLLKMALCV